MFSRSDLPGPRDERCVSKCRYCNNQAQTLECYVIQPLRIRVHSRLGSQPRRVRVFLVVGRERKVIKNAALSLQALSIAVFSTLIY